MKLIITKIKEHLWLFLTAIFFLTIEALSDLLQPTLMSHIVDDGVKNQEVGTVLYFGGIMLIVAFIGAAGAVIRNNLSVRTSQQIGKELRSELYRKIQSFSFENIDRLHSASLITRITNDVTQIQSFVNGTMRILVMSAEWDVLMLRNPDITKQKSERYLAIRNIHEVCTKSL